MKPTSTHLTNAIRSGNLRAVDLLLRHGIEPERPDSDETPLMNAAGMGEMAIVQRLVEAGADVNRCADENSEWTPAFYARQAGHTEVADWLSARMSEESHEQQEQLVATRDPKYQLLYEQATASESLSTDDLVEKLTRWDESYGVTITEARGDRVGIQFSSLPDDMDAFVTEVVDLCPDAEEHQEFLVNELKSKRRVFLWWD